MSSSDCAYAHIRKRILQGVYSEHTPIPLREVERELCLSTIPIREALVRLGSHRLVRQISGRGFFVNYPTAGELQGCYHLLKLFLLDASSFLHECHEKRAAYNKHLTDVSAGASYDNYRRSSLDYQDDLMSVLLKLYRDPHREYLRNCFDRISFASGVRFASKEESRARNAMITSLFQSLADPNLGSAERTIDRFITEATALANENAR